MERKSVGICAVVGLLGLLLSIMGFVAEAKGMKDKYQSLKLAKQVPTSQEDDGLFLEAAGGWSEKGTVYGLGNAVEHFDKRLTTGTTSTRPSYIPSIVSQL